MNQQHDTDQLDGIAIIGLAGRFPGADNVEQFWQNLSHGQESVKSFTDEQLLSEGIERSLLEKPNYVKAGVVLDGIELFDADFFGFTPREAEKTDPQHRIFLECAWEALEDAGYNPERSQSRVGVFAGAGMNNYFLFNIASNPNLITSLSDLQKMLLIDKDYLATRVSYKLNLKGPSLTIQTACSTSLVAVHLACQSLLNGECDMALAGGVALRVPQIAGYLYEEGSIVSPDGHCRAFDADAKGMITGSGAGIVVLKRLEEALAEGDCVRAVILSSSINNDGADKIGYTAPSVDAQANVIAEAHAMAGLNAEEISYIETHGTGTQLGDPIEIRGLTKAFRSTTQKTGYCAIGSVKTNIGHLDAAAGVTGLIKVVLALEKRKLPPSLNFKRPNPNIDFVHSPFFVQQTLSEWKPVNGRRVSGVSSFGIGGTNVHVVVEEAPAATVPGEERAWKLVTISAKTPGALETATDRLAEFLQRHPKFNLSDVTFTLQIGRKAFACRRSFVAQAEDDVINLLQSRDPERVFTGSNKYSDQPITFMFPGQGAQRVNMGSEIYVSEKSFREKVDYCCHFLQQNIGFDLLQVLYPSADKVEDSGNQIKQTSITQPALFVVEYATAKLWMEWGLSPDSMIGHSIGEYVAACLSGVFSLEDALTLVAARGRLMNSMPSGSMIAVRSEENIIREYLNVDLSIATVNGRSACVVSGPTDAVETLQSRLAEEKIACKLLQTSHAFHSRMMEPVLEPFRQLFKNIKLSPPKIPFVSNLTGTWIDPTQAIDPGYWISHLRHTVRFADGLSELLKTPNRILLEVGPGRTLSTFVKQHPAKVSDHVVFSSFGYTRDETSDLAAMLNTLGQLWIIGASADWRAFHSGQSRHRVSLPTYPFERRRYWIEPSIRDSGIASTEASRRRFPHTEDDIADAVDEKRGANAREAGYERPDLNSEYYAPQNDLEKRLANIWRESLGIGRIGRSDSFFELGGDSLLATKIVSQIRDELQVDLPLKRFFEAPTIMDVAAGIEDTLKAGVEELSEEDARRIAEKF